MTRTEFEAFLARTVWRTGDTPFEADLEYMIRMAEARLNRDLHVQQRITQDTLTATSRRIPIPADFSSLRTLSDDTPRSLTYISPHDMERLRAQNVRAPYYTITDMIEVADPNIAATDTKDFEISYYANIPTYTDAETWVQTEFFDLYTNACLIFSAPYLREDDRLGVWQTLYAEALDSALSDNAARTYNGSPLKPRLPGVVA